MTKPWMCFWERRFFHGSSEWVLVHDGQRNPGQFKFSPAEVRFYTRTYRWLIDGKLVNTWVKFIYDLREGEATVQATFHEPSGTGKGVEETLVMGMPDIKEALDGKQAR